MKQPGRTMGLSALFTVVIGCAVSPQDSAYIEKLSGRPSADQLLPVDCLLPPQIRKLGTQMTYLAARQAIKTTALNCGIRGGEYVAYDRADYRTALNVWLEKAKQGDAEAQTYVGEIYEKGLGLEPDYKTSFSWYSKAAGQGFSRAMTNLGYLYEKGLGVEKNTVTALNWYRRASGISDDDIEYSSAIEVKAATLAQEQTYLLEQEVKRRERDIQRLNTSLLSKQQQLKNRELLLQGSLKRRRELEQAMAGTLDQTNRNRLGDAYQQKQQEIEQAQAAVIVLQQQALEQQRLVSLKTGYVVAQKQKLASQLVSGPSIEVFDPSIVITRGGGPVVRVRAGSKARIISGKIVAPAGLKASTINGRPLSVDSTGDFHSAVTVTAKNKQVDILVTDQLEQTAKFSFVLVPKPGSQLPKPDSTRLGRAAASINFGRYFALVIGNNEYQNFTTLQTAINDAQAVAEVLKNKYGFDTRVIRNADRYTILSALNEVKGKLTENDNLLIYYAGHGERDAETLQGYWLPVDAEQENTANWIPNSAISDLLNTMKARHILVVADSCYSGSMTRSSVARIDTELNDENLKKWLKVMAKTNSRTVLTSGGLEPVLDSGGGENSIFAQSFLKTLESAQGAIDAYKIYLSVSKEVEGRAAAFDFTQIPTYAPIKYTGHGGGEFIFIKEKG